MLHLVTVGDYVGIATGTFRADGNVYSALLRHRLEVVGPCVEGACERETVEAQHRLVVLNLAEIEYFAHELRQNPCVALHHLHQRTVARRE